MNGNPANETLRLSVVIATYNRAENLRRTLQSLAAMERPTRVAWEVVVVDNNSNDRTSEVITGFRKSSDLDIHYVLEERQGKSFALNTGIRYSRGEILAFTDDDAEIDKAWIGSICAAF